jgi:hypothetical protein
VALDPHPAMLHDVEMMTLITEEGPLCLCSAPAGFPNGYDSLLEHASIVVVGVVDVPATSLRDVVTSKRAAACPKDVIALPPLEDHLASRELGIRQESGRLRLHPPESAWRPRDDEYQLEVMLPARIRGKLGVVLVLLLPQTRASRWAFATTLRPHDTENR